VTASIDRVSLLIQDVRAEVLLEARLANILLMVGNVLDSLDLNPVLATLGQTLSGVVDTVGGVLTDTTEGLSKRSSYTMTHNILYSVNNYAGETHTNRILAQNGSIVDQSINNDGDVYSEVIVGSYLQDMTFNGYNRSLTGNSQADRELEYVYTPFPGLEIVAAVFTLNEKVVGTKVLSEASGGGSSTVAADEELRKR